ncbi:MAG: restriction endonuclease subunit S [Deltaproteobacteria bacterium]|nr:restriction endonuclease subunit S [Deltaproteobacteria bacterium]
MAGKSRAYLEYKDSGVEWVGSIPVEWKTSRFKYRVALVTDKATTKTNPVGLENINGWTGEFVSSDTEFQGDGVAFQSGDILFGKLRPYLAKVFFANDEGEAVGDFHVFRPNNFEGCFLQYLMLTEEYISIVDGATYGAKMPRASWDFMSNMRIPCPSKCEQIKIANFLDHETAKIDTLIAKQQQLIQLLKEKRQAVISHAVTKGLNPAAPMKDSGVEWLGEMPEHMSRLLISKKGK